MAKRKKEDDEQGMVYEWFKESYPDFLFKADMQGFRLSRGVIFKAQKTGCFLQGYPDIHIIEPRGIYNGCYVEFKRTNDRIYKRDGAFYSDHYLHQELMMQKLRNRGYFANFAVGFKQAQLIIEEYLKLNTGDCMKWRNRPKGSSLKLLKTSYKDLYGDTFASNKTLDVDWDL